MFLLFVVILLIMGVAFALPMMMYIDRRLSDAEAVVLGAVILSSGLGALNLAFLAENVAHHAFPPYTILFGLAPITAGVLGAYALRWRPQGLARAIALTLAAVLALAGLPGYFAFAFAALTAVVTAVLYLAGLAGPRRLIKALDMRG